MPNSTYRDHADMRMKEIHERKLNINIRKSVNERIFRIKTYYFELKLEIPSE